MINESNNSTTSSSLMCTTNEIGADIIVWRIGAFLLPILGLSGHLLMTLTILNTNRRNFHPLSLYYLFISLAESIYLSFMFWDWLDVVNLAPDPRKILNCAYFYPFVGSAATISLVLLACLNIERVSIINHPQITHSNQRILMKIFVAYTIFIFFFIHYHYSVRYSQQSFIIFGQSCYVYEHARQWFYSIWPYIQLFSRLIPCLIIIHCTIFICLNRYRTVHRNSVHRQQQTFSFVLVIVSLYTLCATLPITILQLFNYRMQQYEIDNRYFCQTNSIKANQWKFLNALLIMWEGSTYMNKFYIKLFVSIEFRNHVKQTIEQQWENPYKRIHNLLNKT